MACTINSGFRPWSLHTEIFPGGKFRVRKVEEEKSGGEKT